MKVSFMGMLHKVHPASFTDSRKDTQLGFSVPKKRNTWLCCWFRRERQTWESSNLMSPHVSWLPCVSMNPKTNGLSPRRYTGVNVYDQNILLDVTKQQCVTRISVKKVVTECSLFGCVLWSILCMTSSAFLSAKLEIVSCLMWDPSLC